MSEPPTHPSPIEVAVNLLWCVPGHVGGSEQYLVRQLIGLDTRTDRFVPTLYCLAEFADAHPELARRYRAVCATIDGQRRSTRIVTEHTWLARRTRRADLVHHGGGTTPLVGRRPILLTIHDLQYLTHPEYLTATKLRYLRHAIPRSVERASVVAVPTEYVRRTVIDAYGTAAQRVVVVPHGIEPTLGADVRPAAELRHDYGLGDGPVIVFPAITHPHKGHRFLLELLASTWTDPDLRLVLLGGAGHADAAVDADIERLGLARRVRRPGRVSDADRDGLIAMADALVFPSQYEGFGAPVVEAMALGTPVICSDQPALVEVAGEAAIVRPLTAGAWADALDEAITRRDELAVAGRQRAGAFTAARSGAALAEAYERTLELGDRHR